MSLIEQAKKQKKLFEAVLEGDMTRKTIIENRIRDTKELISILDDYIEKGQQNS